MKPGSPPLIALLTDFGLADNYVGVMKGVMLGICPAARFVDISHGIPPGDIRSAGFLLERSIDYFPEGTVFLVVVDPGVGSERRPMALKTGRKLYVGPDNGVFSRVLERPARALEGPGGVGGPVQTVVLSSPKYRLSRVSNTFHGRDIFAPAAAHLAAGSPIDDLGPPLSDPVRIPPPVFRETDSAIESEVVYVDRFGNLVTAIPESIATIPGNESGSAFAVPGGQSAQNVRVTVGGKEAGPLAESYAAVAEGEPVCVVGGFGLLEISVNGGSAAEYFGVGTGGTVTVSGIRS
jgi:S-adenosylmethionine hydrolase